MDVAYVRFSTSSIPANKMANTSFLPRKWNGLHGLTIIIPLRLRPGLDGSNLLDGIKAGQLSEVTPSLGTRDNAISGTDVYQRDEK